MRTFKIFILSAAISITFAVSAFRPAPAKPMAGNGFAVVELFTSEGCSSCPPADDLVSKIQKEYNNQPVYILAFHVDYWNRLGWKDVFSSADYTKRQQDYVKYLRLSGAYTPQIVVNGRKEFVGSEEGTLRNAIKAGLQKEAAAQITLSDIKTVQNKISLHYQTSGNTNNSVLLLALVQRSAQSNVKAGENRGRNLSHVQIVRSLQTIALTNKSGSGQITLPNGFNAQNSEVIAVLQNTTNGEITGATKTAISVTS